MNNAHDDDVNADLDPSLDPEAHEDKQVPVPLDPETYEDQPVPGPIENPPREKWEQRLKARLVEESGNTIRLMVEAMQGGMSATRALYLIETYASTIKANLSELGGIDDAAIEDFEDDEYGGNVGFGGGLHPYGIQQAVGGRRGRLRRQLRRRLNRLEGGVNQAYPIHGGPDPRRDGAADMEDFAESFATNFTKGLASSLTAPRSRQIQDLTAALKSARDMKDDVLEGRIRAQLDKLLDDGDGDDGDSPLLIEQANDAYGAPSLIEASPDDLEEDDDLDLELPEPLAPEVPQ